MARSKRRTEMTGTGGGRYETRVEAKAASRKVRRERDRREAHPGIEMLKKTFGWHPARRKGVCDHTEPSCIGPTLTVAGMPVRLMATVSNGVCEGCGRYRRCSSCKGPEDKAHYDNHHRCPYI